MKMLQILMGLILASSIHGQTLEKPASVIGEVGTEQVMGLQVGKVSLYVKDTTQLSEFWEDLVKGITEYGNLDFPQVQIYWGWKKPNRSDDVEIDYYPFRSSKPEDPSKPMKVYVTYDMNAFLLYSSEEFGKDDQKAIMRLNRSIFFYYLLNLLKTWDQIGSLNKALELCQKWKLENDGYFILSFVYAQDWQSGKTGLLSIRTLDNPVGINPGFYESGWYLELSEKRGVEDPNFFGAAYFIDPLDPKESQYTVFKVGTFTLVNKVGRYRIEPMKVKGYKTPAPVEIEVKPRETVEIELLYVKE